MDREEGRRGHGAGDVARLLWRPPLEKLFACWGVAIDRPPAGLPACLLGWHAHRQTQNRQTGRDRLKSADGQSDSGQIDRQIKAKGRPKNAYAVKG